jgi:hypothetical protein
MVYYIIFGSEYKCVSSGVACRDGETAYIMTSVKKKSENNRGDIVHNIFFILYIYIHVNNNDNKIKK